jgi:hypothetical protein
MAIENLNDGVGKKIVEALMMQADEATDENMITEEEPEISESNDKQIEYNNSIQSNIQQQIHSQLEFQSAIQQPSIDNAFNQSLAQNLGNSFITDDYEYPQNVAIIRQLVAKLPAGVPPKTGAVIIKQTMEALGISMSSVLEEAKQVQDNLRQSAKDCQASIAEYKKQINILEAKSQMYQRQASGLTDIISLFIQSR